MKACPGAKDGRLESAGQEAGTCIILLCHLCTSQAPLPRAAASWGPSVQIRSLELGVVVLAEVEELVQVCGQAGLHSGH